MAINSLELAQAITKALDSRQADQIRIFDVRQKSAITDFHIVATGTSAPHLRALADELRLFLKEHKIPGYRLTGTPDSGWLVSDCVDVIVHLFSVEARAYYDLDGLWKDAPTVTT